MADPVGPKGLVLIASNGPVQNLVCPFHVASRKGITALDLAFKIWKEWSSMVF